MGEPSTTPSFGLFPCLPSELRLKIWSFALIAYPSRTFRLKTNGFRRPGNNHHVTTIRGNDPQPALAQINQEARREALKYFTQIPTTMVSPERIAQTYPCDYKCALVRFNTDVFAMQRLADIPWGLRECLKAIQFLKVPVKDVMFFPEFLRASRLRDIRSLKEIEFTVAWRSCRMGETLEGELDEDSEGDLEEDSGEESDDSLNEGLDNMVAAFDRMKAGKPNWAFPRVKIVEDGVIVKEYPGGSLGWG